MTPHETIQLGVQARYLQDDPAFKAALARAEADLWTRFKAAETAEEREEIHAETRALARVVGALQALAVDGTAARNRL